MRVCWIYPFRKRCGLREYSDSYIKVLKNKIEIVTFNSEILFNSFKLFKKEVEKCDIVHIQYEPSFFRKKAKDFFIPFVNNIKKPIVVTLHEIYERDPFVYPKEEIKGNILSHFIKRIVWDIRHPIQKSYLLHLSKNFVASKIIVHHYYHKDILIRKGVPSHLIEVIPMFVKKIEIKESNFTLSSKPIINLGAHGFINITYDYDLLFSVLSGLKIPWYFTWIGGLRLNEHKNLLKKIIFQINRNNWQKKFKITGWLNEEGITNKLMEIDIVMALFKIRSTSSSIARVLGCGKPIITTELPLTKEINDNYFFEKYDIPPLIIVEQEPEKIINQIKRLIEDSNFLIGLRKSIYRFRETYSIEKMSERIINIYREILKV